MTKPIDTALATLAGAIDRYVSAGRERLASLRDAGRVILAVESTPDRFGMETKKDATAWAREVVKAHLASATDSAIANFLSNARDAGRVDAIDPAILDAADMNAETLKRLAPVAKGKTAKKDVPATLKAARALVESGSEPTLAKAIVVARGTATERATLPAWTSETLAAVDTLRKGIGNPYGPTDRGDYVLKASDVDAAIAVLAMVTTNADPSRLGDGTWTVKRIDAMRKRLAQASRMVDSVETLYRRSAGLESKPRKSA